MWEGDIGEGVREGGGISFFYHVLHIGPCCTQSGKTAEDLACCVETFSESDAVLAALRGG